MRALYYLLGAAVVFYAVCASTELAERAATRSGPQPASAATPAPAPEHWLSAPADGSPKTVTHGKGVLIEKSTGKRYETP